MTTAFTFIFVEASEGGLLLATFLNHSGKCCLSAKHTEKKQIGSRFKSKVTFSSIISFLPSIKSVIARFCFLKMGERVALKEKLPRGIRFFGIHLLLEIG